MSKQHLETALFVADSHFHLRPGAAEIRRRQRFLDLVESATAADHLVLLGDIFDFWIDYPHFRMRGYEEILQTLDRVRRAGTRLHFVGGNHDIWAAGYFHERYGTAPGGLACTVEMGGLRVRLDHGDGMLGRDRSYAAFRATVRHRLGVALGKSLHPELLYLVSTWLSRRSRDATRDEAERMERLAEAWLAARPAAPWDLKVIGHVHHPYLVEREGRTLASLGGWIEGEGYGLLRDGRFRLGDFATSAPAYSD